MFDTEIPSAVPAVDPRPGPDAASARAAALLRATNVFLEATDVTDLAAAIGDAAVDLFGADRVVVRLLDAAGTPEIVDVRGYDPDEVDRLRAVSGQPLGMALRVLSGDDRWSDDPTADDFRRLIATFGLAAAFVVPIRSKRAIRGTLGVGYTSGRRFEPALREAATGLAAQAGLALELLLTRADLRDSQATLASHVRRTEALLEVSSHLATVTDPDEVADTVVRAATGATGVSLAVIVRWDPVAETGTIIAASGMSAAEEAVVRALRPTIDWGIFRRAAEGSIEVIDRPLEPSDFPLEPFEGWGLRSAAVARIDALGSIWGFIGLGIVSDDATAPEAIREMLRGLAGIASAAIGRIEAYTSLARQAELLEFAVAERTLQLEQVVTELRTANQAKTDFLANVSHELRTPLTAIVGFSELLVNGVDGHLTPNQFEDARTIHDSSRHLLELINDLIDIQQIEAGRIVLHPEPVAIRTLLATTLDELRPFAGTRGIALERIVGDVPETVVADRPRLRQILLNLLTNAVKFTRPGGSVRLVASAETPGSLRIDVEDSGIGIAAEDRDRIFEKFQRAASHDVPGTGLGLSISRELARLHGGDLTVESTLGLGSRFSLSIPVAPPLAGEAAVAG